MMHILLLIDVKTPFSVKIEILFYNSYSVGKITNLADKIMKLFSNNNYIFFHNPYRVLKNINLRSKNIRFSCK